MSFGTALVVIVAIVAFAAMRIVRYNTRSPHERHLNGESPKHDETTRQEIEDLRERIKVLERIATDGNTLDAHETRRIAAEIESLREKQD